jgi:SMI1-KNR4 cell-wall
MGRAISCADGSVVDVNEPVVPPVACSSTLRALIKRCPPTTRRLSADAIPNDPWSTVERSLGTGLPADYKGFIDAYGFVRLDDFLLVFSPFVADGPGNLVTESVSGIAAYRTMRDRFPDNVALAAFPEPGGLLPVARTDNGDDLYWSTIGAPDEWPVVVFGSREREHQRIESDITGLFIALLDRTLVVPVFPDRFPRRAATFVEVDPAPAVP